MSAFSFPLGRVLLAGALLAPFFVSSRCVIAAPKSAPLPRAATSAIDSTRYILGPDDVVSVLVVRHPEFSAEDQVIPASGALVLPVVGTVRFAGRTLAQVDAEITKKMGGRLRRPEVNVSLARPRPRPIYVQGAVKSGGVLEFKNGWRVTQALSAAGGLSSDPDLAAVSVARGGKIILDTKLSPILNDATGKSNFPLQVGDTLRFYQRVVNVSVSGAVAKPGLVVVPTGGGVVEAVGLAGGPLDGASLSKASIRRATGAIIGVNLFKALREGDAAQNIALREGDTINIPATQERVSVLGEVKEQRVVPLEDGRTLRVSDAIARAGGPTEYAALTRATVGHADGTTQPVNLYAMSQGDKSGDLVLLPGDTINVPRARGITVTGEVNKGGIIPLEEGREPRVLDAIAAAGNLVPTLKPERARISIARIQPDGKAISIAVNAAGLLNQTDLGQNSRLQDGDVVSVSSLARALVTIDGNVKTPGQYEIDAGDSVPEVIARAGGATEDAALSRVSVVRGDNQPVFLSLVDAIKRGGARPNFPLQNGDTIVVPRNESRATVLAAVNHPGSYALPEDRVATIGDLISFAGGTSFQAKTKEVALLRKTPTGVQQFIYPMNRADKNGVLAVDVPVQNGDVLFVPAQKTSPSVLQTLAQTLGAVGATGILR